MRDDKVATLPTVCEIPDVLWGQIEPALLELDLPRRKGRKRADQRTALKGDIFRMRSGCQWSHLLKVDSHFKCNTWLAKISAGVR